MNEDDLFFTFVIGSYMASANVCRRGVKFHLLCPFANHFQVSFRFGISSIMGFYMGCDADYINLMFTARHSQISPNPIQAASVSKAHAILNFQINIFSLAEIN